jgi:flagellar biosynthetic protein FlhB
MAETSQQERTEAPTPKRREEARKKGQVVKSREVVSTSLFLGNLLFFGFAGLTLVNKMLLLTQTTLQNIPQQELSLEIVYELFLHYIRHIAWMLLPLSLVIFIVAIVSNILQTGIIFSATPLKPKLSHLSPVSGLKRLFSMQSVNELFKSLVKIGLVGYIAYTVIAGNLEHLFPLIQQPVEQITRFLGQKIFDLGVSVSYVLIVLAVVDFSFQRWQHEKKLRMTTREVKQERKETEGDPQIKSRIRSIMRDAAQKRMMEDVPKADVIVTNPTHLAVALRYRSQEMTAPQVIAKGAGYMAERIKAVAKQHGVPTVENRPVARHLFQTVEIGGAVPETLYKAVAEILAYIYRLKPPKTT